MTVIQNIFFSGRTMQEKWLYQQKLSLYQYCSYKKIEEICPLKQIPVSKQYLMTNTSEGVSKDILDLIHRR
jgi:hypothetical protein